MGTLARGDHRKVLRLMSGGLFGKQNGEKTAGDSLLERGILALMDKVIVLMEMLCAARSRGIPCAEILRQLGVKPRQLERLRCSLNRRFGVKVELAHGGFRLGSAPKARKYLAGVANAVGLAETEGELRSRLLLAAIHDSDPVTVRTTHDTFKVWPTQMTASHFVALLGPGSGEMETFAIEDVILDDIP